MSKTLADYGIGFDDFDSKEIYEEIELFHRLLRLLDKNSTTMIDAFEIDGYSVFIVKNIII